MMRLGMGGMRMAGGLLREMAEMDSQALMNVVPQKIYGALGRVMQGSMGALADVSQSRARSQLARDTARHAVFNTASDEEKRRILSAQRRNKILSIAGVGVGAGVPIGAMGYGMESVLSRSGRFPGEDAGYIGYPGTTYNPPPDLNADGDIVHAMHNVHGTGKNRGTR